MVAHKRKIINKSFIIEHEIGMIVSFNGKLGESGVVGQSI
jgi:hypothetical protein